MPRPLTIEVDIQATRRRIARLRRYVARNLLADGSFVCPHYRDCKASCRGGDVFREGVMSHVGRRLDIYLEGKPLRIVVVGQESGLAKGVSEGKFNSRVTLEDRYSQIRDQSGQRRRYYAEAQYPGRNPHMRGTTSALRVIFGSGLGSDHQGEWIRPANGHPFHIFDGFALVNRLLCSAGPLGTSEGRPTRTMFGNCLKHFGETLSILEPTVVILQGRRVAKRTQSALPIHRRIHDHFYETKLGGKRAFVCEFSHPSAHGQLRWGDNLGAHYLTDTVVPTLQEAVRRL